MMEQPKHSDNISNGKCRPRTAIFICAVLGLQWLAGCNASQDDNTPPTQDTIRFTYMAWACECAQWATGDDIAKYGNDRNTDSLSLMSVYIEPGHDSVQLPDTIGYTNDVIELYGYYLQEPGFPNDKSPGEGAQKARVFRYMKYRIIESHHHAAMELMKEP